MTMCTLRVVGVVDLWVGGVVVVMVMIESTMLVGGGCLCNWLVRLRGSVLLERQHLTRGRTRREDVLGICRDLSVDGLRVGGDRACVRRARATPIACDSRDRGRFQLW